MSKGLIGRKVGMTRVFNAAGNSIGVTVIDATSCVVVQRKTKEVDGYNAIQLGFGPKTPRKGKHSTWPDKAMTGYFKKAGVEPVTTLREFRVDNPDQFEIGKPVSVADLFKAGDHVDVMGQSKGKVFQGTVKRHRFNRGPRTHGNMNYRAPGSIGSSADPSRVFPGQRLPGHMGDERVTAQNLLVVEVIADKNLILVRGAVPGAKHGVVTVVGTKKVSG